MIKKKKNRRNELEYENYKKLLEAVKKRSNQLHFSKLILKYKDNMNKTQAVIEETIGKEKCNQQNLPKKRSSGQKKYYQCQADRGKFI